MRLPSFLPVHHYASQDQLLADLGEKVIRPAERRVLELRGSTYISARRKIEAELTKSRWGLSKVQSVDQRMRLECGVGFRQLRTCRRARPGQLCANSGLMRRNSPQHRFRRGMAQDAYSIPLCHLMRSQVTSSVEPGCRKINRSPMNSYVRTRSPLAPGWRAA